MTRLPLLYQQLADLTLTKCSGVGLGACRPAHSCCSAEYCTLALEEAERVGAILVPTDHPRLPLMGPCGCIAAPVLRKLCSVHVCERAYTQDIEFADVYFKLRDEVSTVEFVEGEAK